MPSAASLVGKRPTGELDRLHSANLPPNRSRDEDEGRNHPRGKNFLGGRVATILPRVTDLEMESCVGAISKQ